jgi:two-component system chemotaxis sensor kinase CheA
MRIEDDELRASFQVSSEEHLRLLDDGLLHLEQYPNDREQLKVLVREIHTLKSTAVMLELKNISSLAHQIEHILAEIEQGTKTVTEELADRLWTALEALHKFAQEAITGEPAGINPFHALASLMGAGASNERPAPVESPPTPTPIRTPIYIDDEELRQTFKIACEEHLQKLDEGLLYLEKQPDDCAKLEELLREIHSIKGDAGMLGVPPMVSLAHEWEHQLIPVKDGTIDLCDQVVDRLTHGLDALRKLALEAITGELSDLDLDEAFAYLSPNSEPLANSPAPNPPPTNRGRPNPPSSSAALPFPERRSGRQDAPFSFPDRRTDTSKRRLPANSALDSNYRIDTIRVETRHLDALMTQAGELTVTKIRIAHRLGDIDSLIRLWEEWSRDIFAKRLLIDELERWGESGMTVRERSSTLNQLQALHKRAEARLESLGRSANYLKNAIGEDTSRLEVLSGELEEGIRTLRLLPLSTIFNLYPRMVRDLARKQGKEVELAISGGETRADKRILEEMKDPLLHILRNAIDHGIETPEEREQQGKARQARLGLRGRQTANSIIIEIMDDGRGLDLEKIKQSALRHGLYRQEELDAMIAHQIQSLIFLPGFSTRSFVTEISGRGVGMDVVRANVERLKGSIQIDSVAGQGCIIRIQLGTTLATAHVLLVLVDGMTYALPVESVHTVRTIRPSDIFYLEGRATIAIEGQPISVAHLSDLLEMRRAKHRRVSSLSASQQPCILLKVDRDRLGLLVDVLLDEQDIILKPQSRLLKRVRNVSGATILGTGEVCMMLNPQDLIKSARLSDSGVRIQQEVPHKPMQQVILLVEDSITTRTQEKRILEGAGYEVVAAVDGLDGLNKLEMHAIDAVVSDVQMPNLDGLEMTARIRQNPQYNELPILLVTSLSSEKDRAKGAEVGANAYITKSSFNSDILLETLRRLI